MNNQRNDARRSRSRSRERRPNPFRRTETGERNKDVERWPNDKFDPNARPDRREFKERRGLGFKKNDRDNFTQDIMDTRRIKREEIAIEGTSTVWGKSPERPVE